MIIASNFKTNHTRASTRAYMEELDRFVRESGSRQRVMVFPPATALERFETAPQIVTGVQNAYPVEKGSFTGEIGLEQIDEFGLRTILVGHSERRHIFGETQQMCAQKYTFFQTHGFEIVYCIGEPEAVRQKGIEAVVDYNFAQLEGIDLDYGKLIVAYEPVWAIGTGLTASAEQIDETLTRLRRKIKAPLLYGGSVKPANTEEILKIENCDGVLVGTASWDVGQFCEMIASADRLA
ncbi:MAG TPA: triose-phosphate isomerase [Campylobacteraceae bacterium]|nr:triose-phosphate isomerase [Campylobacteraceae bacterium]